MTVRILVIGLYREDLIDFEYKDICFQFERLKSLRRISKLKLIKDHKCLILISYKDFCEMSTKNRTSVRTTNTKVVVFDTFTKASDVANSFRLGADGCLVESIALPEFYSSIYSVLNGKLALDNIVTSKLIDSLRMKMNYVLTNRERQILVELSNGRTYRSIGDTMFISVDTVRTHVKHIYDKLQVNNREDALQRAGLN